MPFDEVLFLADCVSYDHDMPTVVRPSANTPEADAILIQPVVPYPGERPGLWYYEALELALSAAVDVRVGDAVELRYEPRDDPLADFGSRFADATEPLTMYAMATRQVDVLAEYLCLYRILEWPNNDNGTGFVEDHLQRVSTHDFGELLAITYVPAQPVSTTSVFDVYKSRASARINYLEGEGLSVSAHLYDIRNRIAHGKRDALTADFRATTAGVGSNLPLVRLLARLVVEDQLR